MRNASRTTVRVTLIVFAVVLVGCMVLGYSGNAGAAEAANTVLIVAVPLTLVALFVALVLRLLGANEPKT